MIISTARCHARLTARKLCHWDRALAVARAYEWFHPIGDVVTALIEAGLTLDFLHEHDRVAWRALPFLEPAERGLWRMPEDRPQIPLSYSLSAHKPFEK